MKHCVILWTRPEIIKCYSLIKLLENQKKDFFIIHTNQHYDKNMDEIFFSQLGLSAPKYNLHIGGWTHAAMSWKMMIEIEKIVIEEKPDIVYVQGDTNSVLAGWLVASKLDWIKLAHIEAGLRSYDRSMPEEINRVVVDHISDYLFCPTQKQADIAASEWIEKEKIFVVWNSIVDATLECSQLESNILETFAIQKNNYFLLTCHRPSNTDNEQNLEYIFSAINQLATQENKKIIFPAHPRLKSKMGFFKKFENLVVVEPVWYLDMLSLQKNSAMIFTDSGWIQEEATILQKKCIILRENTERPETLEVWWAILIWQISQENIFEKYNQLKGKTVSWYNPFGDWKTAQKILEIVENN